MQTNPLKLLVLTGLSSLAFASVVSAQAVSPTPAREGAMVPLINRATGGTASASSELRSTKWNEFAALAFDGNTRTKWYNIPNGGNRALYNQGWIQYQFGNGERWAVTEYKITCGNDVPTRDPKDWELLGSNDGVSWVVLDTRSNQKFERRGSSNTYSFANNVAYGYYRLNITANSKPIEGIQLSELELRSARGPDAPADLTAKPGRTTIELSWKASDGATHYRVSRATASGGPYTEIAQPEGLTCSDTQPKGGIPYYYVVEAVGAAGPSVASNEVSAVMTETPTGLAAKPERDQVVLHWNPVDGDATYNLKRATERSGPYAVVSANIIKPVCTDTALPGGLTYYYVVTSSKDGRESADSMPVSVILPPATPTNVAVSLEKRRAFVSWTASPGAVSYALKRATSEEGPYLMMDPALRGTTWTDMGLNSGRTYFYVVSATNAGGDSLVSNPVSIKVPGWFQRN